MSTTALEYLVLYNHLHVFVGRNMNDDKVWGMVREQLVPLGSSNGNRRTMLRTSLRVAGGGPECAVSSVIEW